VQGADHNCKGGEQLAALVAHVALEHAAQRRLDRKQLLVEEHGDLIAKRRDLLETLLHQSHLVGVHVRPQA
jgi:hypothetical protein